MQPAGTAVPSGELGRDRSLRVSGRPRCACVASLGRLGGGGRSSDAWRAGARTHADRAAEARLRAEFEQRLAEETRRSFEAGREQGRQEGRQAEREAQAAAQAAAEAAAHAPGRRADRELCPGARPLSACGRARGGGAGAGGCGAHPAPRGADGSAAADRRGAGGAGAALRIDRGAAAGAPGRARPVDRGHRACCPIWP